MEEYQEAWNNAYNLVHELRNELLLYEEESLEWYDVQRELDYAKDELDYIENNPDNFI